MDKSLEALVSTSFNNNQTRISLKIGIVGLRAFGQFLAKAFQRQGHNVLETSRSDYSAYCEDNGIQFLW
ncbi:hypothetical protein FRX31_025001 [Thalictrum thalictroides]|uniref:Uncharacterized protein n=1 Tax=Thalictrum thalictroides TaxID=46969 RepID=A0A7J6VM49_THATH|nr:hypothetical protein FRX31_025001 [Thalictrum thalictroides]